MQADPCGIANGCSAADDDGGTSTANGRQRQRVLVFSPHPDDDVISMGGTLARLCQHGHEVSSSAIGYCMHGMGIAIVLHLALRANRRDTLALISSGY